MRRERKPALVHAKVIRPYSTRSRMTSSFTRRRRSARPRRRAIRSRRCARSCSMRRSPPGRFDVIDGVGRSRNRRSDRPAPTAPKPADDTADSFVFSPTVDPDLAGSIRRPSPRARPTRWWRHQPDAERRDGEATRVSSSSAKTSRTPARPRRLPHVPGKGGVFKVTHGLQRPTAPIASSIRRWRRPISSVAPSAWRRAASSPWSKSSSSTTSGRR